MVLQQRARKVLGMVPHTMGMSPIPLIDGTYLRVGPHQGIDSSNHTMQLKIAAVHARRRIVALANAST
jgi:hypothetical protein